MNEEVIKDKYVEMCVMQTRKKLSVFLHLDTKYTLQLHKNATVGALHEASFNWNIEKLKVETEVERAAFFLDLTTIFWFQ